MMRQLGRIRVAGGFNIGPNIGFRGLGNLHVSTRVTEGRIGGSCGGKFENGLLAPVLQITGE